MPTLVITRGLPASGKTTWARAWVAESPETRARVNRDDLRWNLFGRGAPLPYALEQAVTAAQMEAVRGLLEAGRDVVVDDMHLRERYTRRWRELADDCGALFEMRDSFLKVHVEECIRRDKGRQLDGGYVGEIVIRDLHERFKNSLRADSSAAVVTHGYRYVPDTSKPTAWIVDIDGTLALHTGRSPYDYTRVSEDIPNTPVVRLVHHLSTLHDIVIVSGREDSCFVETAWWIREHVGWIPAGLFMRETGDKRDDATAKLEIFRAAIAPFWNVLGVLDDRNRVVRMWRGIGLLCCQVAPGAF